MIRKSILAAVLFVLAALSSSAQNCTAPAGGWTINNQPPAGCSPYPNGLWQKPLPGAGSGGPMTHLAPNSDAIASHYLGYDSSFAGTGTGAVASTGNDATQGQPFYYGRATDPIYKTGTTCTNPGSSPANNPTNTFWHIPNKAVYAGGQSDMFFTVWDQTTNKTLSAYTSGGASGGGGTGAQPLALQNCTATTTGTACSMFRMGFCNMADYTTAPGYAAGNGAGDSLGNAPSGLYIRASEWISGQIKHALYINTNCEASSTPVFPGVSSAFVCPSPNLATQPRHGALIFLDYTDPQLNSIKASMKLWQWTILWTMSHYGGYVGDTDGSSTPKIVPNRYEAGEAYTLAGLTNPLYAWFDSQGLSHHVDGTSQQVYFLPYWANVPLLTGPNCPSTPCGISKHAHIADPCVALSLAGQSGGCVPAPPTVPTFTPSSLAFGNQVIQTQSNPPQPFSFSNFSGSTVTITAITLSDTTNFTLLNVTCQIGVPMPTGNNCAVPLAAKPQTLGVKNATVTVSYTGAGGSPLSGSASVTGIAAPPPPNPTLTPTSNDFGSRVIFTSSTVTNFTFTNVTGSALPITGITVDDPSYVLGSDNCPRSPATLANNGACTIPATFQPHTVGSKPAHLSVAYTGSGSPVRSTLAGVGLAQPLPTLHPTSITYADQIVLTPSVAQTLTLTNLTGSAFTITSVVNSNTTDYSLGSSDCPVSPATLANNAACHYPAIFNPQTTGLKNATITVNWTGPAGAGTPVASSLSGTGITGPPPPTPTLAPTNNDFGSRVIFTAGAVNTFTFTNLSGVALAITAVAVDDPTNYLLGADNCPRSPTTIPNNGTCTAPVRFDPQSVGSKPAHLTVSYTGSAGSPISSTLAGVGLAQPLPTLLPSPIGYGNQVINTPSNSQTLTLTNVTGSALTITSVVNSDTTNYSVGAGNCPVSPATLASAGACTMPAIFNPQSLGLKNATVTVNWTGPGGAGTPVAASLSGTGVPAPPPTVTITPTSHGFGSVTAGAQSSEFTFTVANGIGSTLNIGQLGKIGPNPGSFTLLDDNCSNQSLPSSGQCTYGAKCTPPITQPGGSISASISFPDNAAGSPHSAPMTCTVLAPALAISPSPLDFGSVLVGSQSDIAATVTNSGTATVTFNTVAMLAGTNFLLLSNGCTAPVAPAAHCNFTVRFKPLSVGLLSDSVRISDNASDSPQNLMVSGTGGGTNSAFSPPSINFGQIPTGLTAVAPTVFHSGSSAINISNITTPANFGQSGNCGLLSAFQSCNFQPSFSPTAVQAYSGNINVFYDDALLADLNLQSSPTNWSTCIKPSCDPGGVGPPTAASQTFGASAVVVAVAGPAFTNALWINKHFGSTWNSATKFVFNWRMTLDANGPTAEALEYDFFLFRAGTEFMFGSQCHQTGSAKWQVWDQLNLAWVDTTLPCSLTPLVAHDVQWTGHISGSNMVYDILTIDGTPNTINMTEPSGPTGFADGTGIHFQLDIGPGGQSLSESLTNINFLALAADGFSPALLPLSGAGVSPPPPPASQASGVLGNFGTTGTSGVQ